MKIKTILVTGGSGKLGRSLIPALLGASFPLYGNFPILGLLMRAIKNGFREDSNLEELKAEGKYHE